MEIMMKVNITEDEILDKVYIGIQRSSGDPIAKRETPFDGIEQYLWVNIDGERSFKVPDTLGSEPLWEAAKRNTFAETRIRSMAEVMSEMMGIELPEMEPVQYILTNGDGFRGAACVLNRAALEEFAKVKGVDRIFMLPSSIHEVLLIPDTGDFAKADLDDMVRTVNATQVDYDDQLGDHAYVVTF